MRSLKIGESWRPIYGLESKRNATISNLGQVNLVGQNMMRLCTILFCVFIALQALAQPSELCGPLANAGQYGPYDYRTDKDKLGIVEINHFTVNVERLVGGITGTLGGDIDYTLRAFPNHHRALISMSRLAEKLKLEKPPGAHYTLACYFDRSIRFRPDDGMVRIIYANYLMKSGKNVEAVREMEDAEKTLDDSANLHYNLGLAYFGLKDYDKALFHAHRAYELGFPLPGLRNLLTRENKWSEQRKLDPVKADALPTEELTSGSTGISPPTLKGN